jgi:hypothetical protein
VLNSRQTRVFHAADERTPKTEDSLAERVEFELASDSVAFLASDRAAFISGADYVLDGGSMPTV